MIFKFVLSLKQWPRILVPPLFRVNDEPKEIFCKKKKNFYTLLIIIAVGLGFDGANGGTLVLLCQSFLLLYHP